MVPPIGLSKKIIRLIPKVINHLSGLHAMKLWEEAIFLMWAIPYSVTGRTSLAILTSAHLGVK